VVGGEWEVGERDKGSPDSLRGLWVSENILLGESFGEFEENRYEFRGFFPPVEREYTKYYCAVRCRVGIGEWNMVPLVVLSIKSKE